jgi:hypothetical protein
MARFCYGWREIWGGGLTGKRFSMIFDGHGWSTGATGLARKESLRAPRPGKVWVQFWPGVNEPSTTTTTHIPHPPRSPLPSATQDPAIIFAIVHSICHRIICTSRSSTPKTGIDSNCNSKSPSLPVPFPFLPQSSSLSIDSAHLTDIGTFLEMNNLVGIMADDCTSTPPWIFRDHHTKQSSRQPDQKQK